ncbi:hypothetical protein P4O66_001183 [Electrophorus voltai]|uniref:Uncharacterized protein n=1 Tax=Electrophorus voltai TaxID=2609070 RepID=A0AAD9DWF2_9TELE|nr:hypothetical protein P4O66_001183 [Electrophorus voltai]
MESPSSADRRQAWAHSSRYWLTLEDSEPRGPCAAISDPSAHLSLQDEVFTDGCSTGKIETWLQGCGNEANQENLSHLTVDCFSEWSPRGVQSSSSHIPIHCTAESLLKTGNSFEDDLSLGAEGRERKRLPDLNREKSLLLGWVGSFTIFLALVWHRL